MLALLPRCMHSGNQFYLFLIVHLWEGIQKWFGSVLSIGWVSHLWREARVVDLSCNRMTLTFGKSPASSMRRNREGRVVGRVIIFLKPELQVKLRTQWTHGDSASLVGCTQCDSTASGSRRFKKQVEVRNGDGRTGVRLRKNKIYYRDAGNVSRECNRIGGQGCMSHKGRAFFQRYGKRLCLSRLIHRRENKQEE